MLTEPPPFPPPLGPIDGPSNTSQFKSVHTGWVGLTWVEVLLDLYVSDDALRSQSKVDVMEHHRFVSTRIATHMQLTFENIARFSWLLGAMLSPNPEVAQENAREVRRILATKSSHSCLAMHIAEDEELMSQLNAYCEVSPPVALWQGRLAYKGLFIFISARFLANPDHVLDCEGVHSRWKWICDAKHSVKMKTLNAVLKLSAHILHYGDLPAWDDLRPYIQQVRTHLRQQYEQVRLVGEVGVGARADWIYRDRFNLTLADADLLRCQHGLPLKAASKSSPQVTIEKMGVVSLIFVSRPRRCSGSHS